MSAPLNTASFEAPAPPADATLLVARRRREPPAWVPVVAFCVAYALNAFSPQGAPTSNATCESRVMERGGQTQDRGDRSKRRPGRKRGAGR
jgi:hypothetical protein